MSDGPSQEMAPPPWDGDGEGEKGKASVDPRAKQFNQIIGWLILLSGAAAVVNAIFSTCIHLMKGNLYWQLALGLVLTVVFGLLELGLGFMILRGALWAKACAGVFKALQIPALYTPVVGFSWYSGLSLTLGWFNGRFVPHMALGGFFNLFLGRGLAWGCGINIAAIVVFGLIIMEYIVGRRAATD